jgi:hypothetical protein
VSLFDFMRKIVSGGVEIKTRDRLNVIDGLAATDNPAANAVDLGLSAAYKSKIDAYPAYSALAAAIGVSPFRKIKWHFLGNSIVQGQSLAAGQTWPTRMVARLRGGSGYHTNKGVPSDTITQMAARYATDVTAKLSANEPNVLVFGMPATNDLIASASGATCYGRITSLLDTAVLDSKLTKIVYVGTGPSTAITAGAKETARTDLIALELDATTGLVARYGVDRIFYIDPRTVPELIDTAGTIDGTHPTATTCQNLGDSFALLVNDWLGYNEPSPKTRTHCHEAGDFCTGEWDPANKVLLVNDVTTLSDTSGKAHDLTWAGSTGGNGQRPLWTANGGKPFITFDSTNNEALVFNGNLLPSKGPFHLIMYITPLATTSGRIWAQSNAGASRLTALSLDAATPINASWENIYDSGSPANWTVGDPDDPSVRAAPKMTAAAKHMVELINDGNRLRLVIDETECANVIANPASITTIGFSFGGIWLGPGQNMFTPKSFDLHYAAAFLRALPYNRARDIKAFIHSKVD